MGPLKIGDVFEGGLGRLMRCDFIKKCNLIVEGSGDMLQLCLRNRRVHVLKPGVLSDKIWEDCPRFFLLACQTAFDQV